MKMAEMCPLKWRKNAKMKMAEMCPLKWRKEAKMKMAEMCHRAHLGGANSGANSPLGGHCVNALRLAKVLGNLAQAKTMVAHRTLFVFKSSVMNLHLSRATLNGSTCVCLAREGWETR